MFSARRTSGTSDASRGGRSGAERRVLLLLLGCCACDWGDGFWVFEPGCFSALRRSLSSLPFRVVNSLLSDINSVISHRCEVIVRFCSITSSTMSPYEIRNRTVSSGSNECLDLGASIGRASAASEIKQVPRSVAPACGLTLRLQLLDQQLFGD